MIAGFSIGKHRAPRGSKEAASSLKTPFLYYIKKAKAQNKDSSMVSDVF